MKGNCIKCRQPIDPETSQLSMAEFNVPLCSKDHNWIKASKSSAEARILFFALLKRGIPAQIEKYDGYKRIDIAIPSSKLNIEVDGSQHHNFRQALVDLKRTYYSFIQGYFTLRIPNSLIKHHLTDAVDLINDFVAINNPTGNVQNTKPKN